MHSLIILYFLILVEIRQIRKNTKKRVTRFKSSDSEAFDEVGEGEFESKELEYFSDTPNSSEPETIRYVKTSTVNEGKFYSLVKQIMNIY